MVPCLPGNTISYQKIALPTFVPHFSHHKIHFSSLVEPFQSVFVHWSPLGLIDWDENINLLHCNVLGFEFVDLTDCACIWCKTCEHIIFVFLCSLIARLSSSTTWRLLLPRSWLNVNRIRWELAAYCFRVEEFIFGTDWAWYLFNLHFWWRFGTLYYWSAI